MQYKTNTSKLNVNKKNSSNGIFVLDLQGLIHGHSKDKNGLSRLHIIISILYQIHHINSIFSVSTDEITWLSLHNTERIYFCKWESFMPSFLSCTARSVVHCTLIRFNHEVLYDLKGFLQIPSNFNIRDARNLN
ncbi:Hypothetical_protein [Hexamita inflata]|uniref:Hypothetical_protein n=1 Tax=Hexamita inflata TaxID=28002 RepID=A0AA86QV20_9EUKA|nr:Hypothetical protein HINF_LOCUS49670 [Hexamita inflata]CAI9962027.1 Hypothetical protein HINF_LOCUS49672 [Hexamita inflata]CAI9962029.1 Hypothetical protein HINF_LOCUS49674 [Hexamita inflata]CAI9962031.1 Hypothetical protein HINF_LOCUS49676 [Hexamita inflata]